ncbi:MAG: hypothetical protein JWO38_4619 [Gemmataceae bacterium]|nr:hypothetical protein [Gemmataceae bacterium]
MYRLLTASCPKCQNRFHAEADDGDSPAPVGSHTRCPRCNEPVRVPADAGVLQPHPTPWAVRTSHDESGD